ncbi:hypothetical protein V8G54_003845, partial [Vigna mungo]
PIRICEYKGVNVLKERAKRVLPSHKIGDNSLRQMGFIKQGNLYIHSNDVSAQAGKDDKDIHMPNPTHAARPSHVQKEFSLESLSRQMTEMARLQNEMMSIQNTRHEEICTHLKNLDERIFGLERHFEHSNEF